MASVTNTSSQVYPNYEAYCRSYINATYSQSPTAVTISSIVYGYQFKRYNEDPVDYFAYLRAKYVAGGFSGSTYGPTNENISSYPRQSSSWSTRTTTYSTDISISRTHSKQTKTYKCTAYFGAGNASSDSTAQVSAYKNYSSRLNKGYSSVATITITIPAKDSYSVTYDANGGSGAPVTQTKWYGESLVISGTIPKRSGYTFKGWATSSSSTTVAYSPSSTYKGNAALALYAVWSYNYKAPTIANVSIERCTSSGTLDDSGAYAKVTFKSTVDTGDIYTSNAVNTATVQCGTASAINATAGSENTYSAIVGGTLDSDTSYPIVITVDDTSGRTDNVSTFNGYVPTAVFPLDFAPDGRGVAFGASATSGEFLINKMDLVLKYPAGTGDVFKMVNSTSNEDALKVDEDGDLTLASHSSPIGTVVSASFSNKTLATDSWNPLGSANGEILSLDPGVWVVEGGLVFASNGTGNRGVRILNGSDGVSAVLVAVGSTGEKRIRTTAILSISSTTTVKLSGYQTSGSAMTVSGNMSAVRIV